MSLLRPPSITYLLALSPVTSLRNRKCPFYIHTVHLSLGHPSPRPTVVADFVRWSVVAKQNQLKQNPFPLLEIRKKWKSQCQCRSGVTQSGKSPKKDIKVLLLFAICCTTGSTRRYEHPWALICSCSPRGTPTTGSCRCPRTRLKLKLLRKSDSPARYNFLMYAILINRMCKEIKR